MTTQPNECRLREAIVCLRGLAVDRTSASRRAHRGDNTASSSRGNLRQGPLGSDDPSFAQDRRYLTRDEFTANHGASPTISPRIAEFARAHDLAVVHRARRGEACGSRARSSR